MEKYKVEVNSTEAHEGRGSRRSGGWSRWSKSINLANGVKTAGRDSFRGSGKMICSERKALQESQREKKEEMRQQQRMKVMTDMTRKIKPKGRMDARNSWWVSELLAADCQKAWLHPGCEDTIVRWHKWLFEMKKNDEEKRMEVEH